MDRYKGGCLCGDVRFVASGLPDRVGMKQLVMAAFVAALGLTVALFVAGAAFKAPELQGQAKMGALFSGGVAIAAIVLARVFRIRNDKPARPAAKSVSGVPST